MRRIKVELELPEELLLTARISKRHASEELKKLVAFELYRRGTISLGKACQLASISKWEFFEMNKTLQIPISYTEEDGEEDKETAKTMSEKDRSADVSRRRFLKAIGSGILGTAVLVVGLLGLEAAMPERAWVTMGEELFVSKEFTAPGGFTRGIEGPACDSAGNLYAVNYERQSTIGKVTPEGECSVFVELPDGSIGNGIRFNSDGFMLIADYVHHNILQVDMQSRKISVYAHEPGMNQPNDLALSANDLVYASDPNWKKGNGQIWRVAPDGTVTLLEGDMGTTNGIEVGPDEKTLYVNESVQRKVWAYDLSPEGEISNKRLLIQFPDFGLDGMRCDVAGNLYITRYGKGTVVKVSPEGEVLLEVQLTGKNPSNIAFGGPAGRTGYVTLADRGNIETFRADQPGRSWQLVQERKSSSTGVAPKKWGETKDGMR